MDRGGEYPRCLWKYNIWQAKQFISNTVTTGGWGKPNPRGGSNPCRGCDCLCWIYWVRGEGKLYLEGAHLSAPKTLISLSGPRLWIMQHVREHLSSTHTHTHTGRQTLEGKEWIHKREEKEWNTGDEKKLSSKERRKRWNKTSCNKKNTLFTNLHYFFLQSTPFEEFTGQFWSTHLQWTWSGVFKLLNGR